MKETIVSVAAFLLFGSQVFAYNWECVDVYDDAGNRYEAVLEDWGSWKELHIQRGGRPKPLFDSFFENSFWDTQRRRLHRDDCRGFRKDTEEWLYGDLQE